MIAVALDDWCGANRRPANSQRRSRLEADTAWLEPREEAMKLTDTHFNLLRELVELPAHRRVSTGCVSPGFAELKDAGLARVIPIGVLDLLTEITDDGRKALANAERPEVRAPVKGKFASAANLGF
jgi:hypothetical protein